MIQDMPAEALMEPRAGVSVWKSLDSRGVSVELCYYAKACLKALVGNQGGKGELK
jgi:hypothetical protein